MARKPVQSSGAFLPYPPPVIVQPQAGQKTPGSAPKNGRTPGYWLASIQSPTFVFEGTGGNIDCLRAMAQTSRNPHLHCIEVRGANHFNLLAPTNRLIANKILRDQGAKCNLSFTAEEVTKAVGR